MAEMTRTGYVYINVGSLGEDVVKIGLTRRLDPEDRVRELGDASVPFVFDTHALIYSDDAPALEAALHAEFGGRRVNASNMRKEFFRLGLEEVEEAVDRLARTLRSSRIGKPKNIGRRWLAVGKMRNACGGRWRTRCPRRSERSPVVAAKPTMH